MRLQIPKNAQLFLGALVLTAVSFYVGGITKELELLKGSGTRFGETPALPSAPAPSAPETAGDVDPVSEADHVRGNLDAKIALIEYSDYECPYCQQFHPTAQQVIDEYGGDVMWVYRHFPLDSIHPNARPAAIAAECVAQSGGNDAFWAYTDTLFGGASLSESSLISEAANLGLDITSCLQNAETESLVDAGLESGTRAGITGTPGNILLNVETGDTLLVPGALPFAQMSDAIDSLL